MLNLLNCTVLKMQHLAALEFPLIDPEQDEEMKDDMTMQVMKTNVELRERVPRFEVLNMDKPSQSFQFTRTHC